MRGMLASVVPLGLGYWLQAGQSSVDTVLDTYHRRQEPIRISDRPIAVTVLMHAEGVLKGPMEASHAKAIKVKHVPHSTLL